MSKKIILAISILALAGCESTSSQTQINCQQEDWQLKGKTAVTSGSSIRIFDSYAKKCSTNLPATAKADFIQGYTEGLEEFCTYSSGFERGEANLPITNICPLENRTAFLNGYKMGNVNHREKMHSIEKAKKDHDAEAYKVITGEGPEGPKTSGL